jgi:hypothetical protein
MPVPPSIDKYQIPRLLGTRAVRRFHVMAKPAGSACNLDCTYCFYLSKQGLAGGPGAGHMDDQLLERFIRDYIAGVTGDEVVFSWQGGEPTLMGLDFFRKVVALQARHARPIACHRRKTSTRWASCSSGTTERRPQVAGGQRPSTLCGITARLAPRCLCEPTRFGLPALPCACYV